MKRSSAPLLQQFLTQFFIFIIFVVFVVVFMYSKVLLSVRTTVQYRSAVSSNGSAVPFCCQFERQCSTVLLSVGQLWIKLCNWVMHNQRPAGLMYSVRESFHTLTHTYTHTHTHTHTHSHSHTHSLSHSRAHTHTRAHIHTRARARAHLHTRALTLWHTHSHTRAHTHSRAHTHTHSHIYLMLHDRNDGQKFSDLVYIFGITEFSKQYLNCSGLGAYPVGGHRVLETVQWGEREKYGASSFSIPLALSASHMFQSQ